MCHITFQSYYGKGVQEGLSLAEERSGINNNVFGVGFEGGEKISIGCSRKGRIWSYSRGTINQFINWCDEIAVKLTDDNIDPNQILRNTIKPKKVSVRPAEYPISVDWHHKIYESLEEKVIFNIEGVEYDLSSIEINTYNPSENNPLSFSLDTENKKVIFQLNLGETITNGNRQFYFNIDKISREEISVRVGSKNYYATEFFNEYPPTFWFHDGSFLQGNEYVKFNEEILNYPQNEIETWDWSGVNLSKESEGFSNINENSIQYYCIEKLIREGNYDVIYNDDNSGEIADIVAIKNTDREIHIDLFHLKFASRGVVSHEIKNLYEVCGQAQKSLAWKYKENNSFFRHLIKRECNKQRFGQTRIRKGNIELLEKLSEEARRKKNLKFNIAIVQPGFSKETATQPILKLLGVTANHLKKEGGIDLRVIAS